MRFADRVPQMRVCIVRQIPIDGFVACIGCCLSRFPAGEQLQFVLTLLCQFGNDRIEDIGLGIDEGIGNA